MIVSGMLAHLNYVAANPGIGFTFNRGNGWSIPSYSGYPTTAEWRTGATYAAGGQCYDSDGICSAGSPIALRASIAAMHRAES